MRCSKAREYVSRDLDALLPPDATVRLRDHLDACTACREYREDLLLGRRVLAATEPTLPDNFEWKLQLRLNQALQQAAGEVQFPWHEERTDRGAWLRNFGAATAVGLAAVLALAMIFGPAEQTLRTTGATGSVAASDRLPLFQPAGGGLYQPTGRAVSTAGPSMTTGNRYLDRGWSGSGTEDLITIRRLRAENQRLTSMLLQYQRTNESLRARLDTTGTSALDLGQEH